MAKLVQKTETSDGLTLWADISLSDVGGHSLNAQIPFLLPPGVYQHPDLASLADQDTIWLKEWLVRSGLIRRGDTGEEMLRRAQDMCIGSALFIPDIPPTSPKMHIYTYFFALAVFMDDLIEGKNLLGREKEKGLEIANLGGEVIMGKYETFDDLPLVYPVVMPIFKALLLASKEARDAIPEFETGCQDFVKATNESFVGMALMQLEDSIEEVEPLPEDYFRYLRRYDAGCEAFIELAALIVGITLPPSMKDHVLFRRVVHLASSITAHVNDLFGVRTDVEKGEGFSLVLFKAKSVMLPEAFAQVNRLVQEQTLNMSALCGRLRILYPRYKSLDKFLRVIENLVDGHVHYCTINKKYGDVNVTFVQRPRTPATQLLISSLRHAHVNT